MLAGRSPFRDAEMKKGIWACLFFCATSCLVSLHLGQDNNFDLKGYHIYNAWALMTGRWSQDIFAAGAQTYFSPFLDIPYYLVAAGLFPSHGAYVVALAGLPYGALLLFIYLISGRFARSLELEKWDRAAFIAASVLLAGTGAATWSLVGTTFNDITIAAIVLAAFHQMLIGMTNSEEEPAGRRVAAAGMLLGLATGLKLTAAIYVPPMAIVIFSAARGWRNQVRSLVIYGCCVFAVFVAIYGPWAWKLYGLTGNPFFPLLNGVFHSDWMTSINVRDERFLPKSWLQWLFYPFYWTALQSWLVTEVPFRDMRVAIAYVFLAGYAAIALTRKDLRTKFVIGKYRPVHVLVLFLAFSYVLWMREFSILRYLVATECLAGIFIVIGIMAAARRLGRRAAGAPALCVMSIAGFIIGYTVSPQWGRGPVGTNIFALDAPRFEQGALLIFADAPMSFLAPGLAATSQGLRFMAIPRGFAGGQLGADGLRHELGRRMKATIAENAKSLYVLFHKSRAPPEASMAAFDIRLDMASCQPGRSSLLEFVACRGIYPKARPKISR
jgi:hypothetical protein